MRHKPLQHSARKPKLAKRPCRKCKKKTINYFYCGVCHRAISNEYEDLRHVAYPQV